MDFNPQAYKAAIEKEFTIVDKDKNEVPFILNKAQNDFIQNITDRNVILKCRKLGFSSLILAIGTLKFLLGRNERIVSMSFDASASIRQLERVKRFIASFERKNNIKIPFKYNSKNELVYHRLDEDGQEYTNSFRIGTAKSDSFGRGDDVTFLHLTEVSLSDNIEELLAGVGEAVVNNAMITLETTAAGHNPFKTFWDEATLGERVYKTFFYNPTWEYSKAFLDNKRLELGRLFDQEYPMTPEIAFLSSGELFFSREALQAHLLNTRDPMPPGSEGLIYA